MEDKELIGEVIYRWTPDRSKFDRPDIADVAHEYVVTKCDDALCGIIVYGKYHGKWHANPSARALIVHLLDIIQLYRLKRSVDGLNNRDWDAGAHLSCEDVLNAIGEPVIKHDDWRDPLHTIAVLASKLSVEEYHTKERG